MGILLCPWRIVSTIALFIGLQTLTRSHKSLSNHIYAIATQMYLQGYTYGVIIKDVETKYHDIPIW